MKQIEKYVRTLIFKRTYLGNLYSKKLTLRFPLSCRYADIYTSRVSNFLHYTPFMYFRSQEQVFGSIFGFFYWHMLFNLNLPSVVVVVVVVIFLSCADSSS